MIKRKNVIKTIKECKEIFDVDREKLEYGENNAWYFLGVFDTLFGLLPDPPTLEPNAAEDLTIYLNRTVTEFLEKNGKTKE